MSNLEDLRREVRAWLRANLPTGWGTPQYVPPAPYSREAHELGKAWTKKLYDAGYTAFSYPKEYGGIVRPPEEIAVISQEMARTGTPGGPLSLGLLVAAPAILVHGEEWQKKRFIPKILSGEEAWCEGFSEPDAGSDLANVGTSAVRDGDGWIVNGQKVWTSMWEFADWGLLVVKTEPNAPRHRNLSYFLFDTNTPGFSRRPLRQMSGEAEFGEMFFDNMRIPHKNMMGGQGQGWYVAMTALTAERSGGGSGFIGGAVAMGGLGTSDLIGADVLVELAKKTKRYGKSVWEESAFRQRIMQIAIEFEALRWSGTRLLAKVMAGTPIGNEASVLKNFQAEMRQRRGDLTCDIIGAYSQMIRGSTRSVDEGDHVYNMLRARGATIEMGTSEINRNIIAERILGLPR
jgi:alkylation response protein AidB-like acyl-CoA dehydrogenase